MAPSRWALASFLRVGAVIVLAVLGLLAWTTTRPAVQAVAIAAPTVTIPPAPSVTPRPTQTPQNITSIIVRETLVPFPTSTPFPSSIATVSIVDFSYMPGVTRIKAGQSVLWRNDGTEQHDVTGSDWHSGPLDPTYTYRLTFGLPGTYNYRCSIHLDMTGTLIVS